MESNCSPAPHLQNSEEVMLLLFVEITQQFLAEKCSGRATVPVGTHLAACTSSSQSSALDLQRLCKAADENFSCPPCDV